MKFPEVEVSVLKAIWNPEYFYRPTQLLKTFARFRGKTYGLRTVKMLWNLQLEVNTRDDIGGRCLRWVSVIWR